MEILAAARANVEAMTTAPPPVPPARAPAPPAPLAAPPAAPLAAPPAAPLAAPPVGKKCEVEVILSDEERTALAQRAEEMALKSLQNLPPEKRTKALPAVTAGILKRLLSQARNDEPTPSSPPHMPERVEAPPPPPALDTCDDEELERLRCSHRVGWAPKELPPPQDGVEAFGDDPWFAQLEVREALAEAVEAHHGSFKILVGDPAAEIARICPSEGSAPLKSGAVLRLGGANGGFGEPDVAYAYRQLSRALHPDKNPDHPHAGEAFRRLKEAQDELKQSLEQQRNVLRGFSALFRVKDEGELQMKRPQCALLAEASRLLGAVLALTPQGFVPPGALQRANAFLRLPEGTWAWSTASTEALLAQWRDEKGQLLEAFTEPVLRNAYDCAPKRYRAQFLCLLARAAQLESDASDGCVRRTWSKVFEMFPEIQLWQELRQLILKKRQVHGRRPKRGAHGLVKMGEADWSSWAKRWRKLILAVLPSGEEEAAAWSDPELRKLCAALWRDFADPLEKEDGEDAATARRCLNLFRAESRKSSDVECQQGAAPAEWAFVPASDLLLLLGEGFVGVTLEGVFAAGDGARRARLAFASAIFRTMM
ncbi:unnamed protein product [Durusdinium trenchii]|uniref:J domain-containing protein n=1 Tax=Durusdinium trenchii TaxID=1381693 RepID=A0ABP0IWQ3_9DINO